MKRYNSYGDLVRSRIADNVLGGKEAPVGLDIVFSTMFSVGTGMSFLTVAVPIFVKNKW